MKEPELDLVPVYKAKALKKINAMRKTESQPDIEAVPVLSKAQVLFVTASSREDQPNSCYNCWKFNLRDRTCSILPKEIRVRKFTSGEPYKRIEYWPVCGLHEFGKPNIETPIRRTACDPDYMGLSWVNAPTLGQTCGGTCCGGANGGDDCDYWKPPEGTEDKREASIGFCRVLQTPTANGDCCAAWIDDDILSWQDAQAVIKEQDAK